MLHPSARVLTRLSLLLACGLTMPTIALAQDGPQPGPQVPPPPPVPQALDEEPGDEAPPPRRTQPGQQDDGARRSTGSAASSGTESAAPVESRQKPPQIDAAVSVSVDFVDAEVKGLISYFANVMGKNFILPEDFKADKITIISHKPVSKYAAWEAFLSALEVAGYTVVEVGEYSKVVALSDAGTTPLRVGQGGDVRNSDQYVTQLIPLENVSVSEVSSLVQQLASSSAKILTYAETNTLIITDSGANIRKIFKILNELDVAAPRATMEIYQLTFADATELKTIIEELYGVQASSSSSSNNSRASTRGNSRAARRRAREQAAEASTTSAGEEGSFISKVLADERMNALVVLANSDGHEAIASLLSKVDVDVELASRTRVYVEQLEHAKAEDVAQVIQNLSQGSSSSSNSRNNRTTPRNNRPNQPNAPDAADANGAGAAAVFDSGMRVTYDENTNSLVIIAAPEEYKVIASLLEQLDVQRRQVFVDCVVLELTSEDTFELGLAYHTPMSLSDDAYGIVGGQFGTSSVLGLSQDLLTGLAVGIFGDSITLPVSDGAGGTVDLDVPAFGIVLNAIKSNSATNIVSNPSVLTLDNEEARFVVGRQVPFPTQSSVNNLTGTPIVSYQREDVAVTLQVTPRVNSADFVTLEMLLEVADIEEDDQGLDVSTAGFITSKREVETVALVRDNQTVVLGGLMGTTSSNIETKVPVLGDLPLIGALFRGTRKTDRKTNLIVFLTPHVVDDEEDMWEIMRVKEAQRQEFLRRFYGRSRDQQIQEIKNLLQYSMNNVDQPSLYRGSISLETGLEVGGSTVSDETRAAAEAELAASRGEEPGAGAGELPADEDLQVDLEDLPEDLDGE